MILAKLYSKLIDFMHRPLREPVGSDPYHAVFGEFVALSAQRNSPSILEIGARNVTGAASKNLFPNCENYVGFDIVHGDGVDVVGDVHSLSKNFSPDSFDFVYSVSVFEHVFFPWKAVLEMNKVVKTGGYVFLSSHPVWPVHELPWDFWRFSSRGLNALFNKRTGFEVISVAEGLPCKVYSLVHDPATRSNCLPTMNQGVALIARKVGDYHRDLLKWDIDVDEILDTTYPAGEAD